MVTGRTTFDTAAAQMEKSVPWDTAAAGWPSVTAASLTPK